MRIRDVWLTDVPLTVLETAVALRDGSVFLDRALQRRVRFPPSTARSVPNMGRRGSSAAGRLLVAAADRADSPAERLLVRILRDAGITGWVLGHPFGPWFCARHHARDDPKSRASTEVAHMRCCCPCPGPVVGSAAARELRRRAQNEELRAPWRARRPEVARDLRCSCHKGRALVDGWAWHVDPERFRADRRKQNALVRDGWDPLRFTWHDLDQRPRSMADEIWSTVQGR